KTTEQDYYLVGSSNYCSKCLFKKFEGQYKQSEKDFQAKKDYLEKLLYAKLASKKIEAAFFEVSKYMEKISRQIGLKKDQAGEPENLEDFFCIAELRETLEKCPSDNSVAYQKALEEIGVCTGSECIGLSGSKASLDVM